MCNFVCVHNQQKMIKNINTSRFWCYWALIFLFGCNNSSDDVLLRQMERIKQDGNTNPWNALNELSTIEPEIINNNSCYVYNKYLLLMIRLRDKTYITTTSSDTIENVVDYFEKHGNDNELMESYYYQGSIYRDLKDYPRAITSFIDALDIAKNKDVKDYPLLQNTYSQLSGLYKKQQLYEESLKMAKAGYKMAIKTNTVDPIYIMDVASSALHIGDTIEARKYSLKALDWIKNNQSLYYPDVVCELLIKFSEWKMKEEAEKCLEIIHYIPDGSDIHNYLAAMAHYYEGISMMDSAMDYNRRILTESGNLSQRMSAAHRLMDYYIQHGIYNISVEYSKIYAQLVDSAFLENQYEQTSRACGNHLYATSMRKEMEAQKEANEYKIKNYFILICFLFSLLLFAILYGQRKRKFTKLLIDKQKRLDFAQNTIKQYDLKLEEAEKEKSEKEKIIAQFNNEIKSLNECIAHYQANILNKQNQIRELARMSFSDKVRDQSDVLLKKLNEASQGKGKLEDSDWKILYANVETIYPGFRASVTSMPRTSEIVIKTAYLLKMGFSNPQIENITQSSRTTVWERVKKINEHLRELFDNEKK